ncbi:hypothetical protein SKAU_G00299300 [Synaphobranchus kaupii]|uniref:Uncharacterized protein n=1 Tax=Synaphobranchus kaupii TaxID=118154 RepID=A0A9Q1EVH9_SYNKA|nr:hypothetical protein SKAU_G00299300 [Synaphobranchus kaupii]
MFFLLNIELIYWPLAADVMDSEEESWKRRRTDRLIHPGEMAQSDWCCEGAFCGRTAGKTWDDHMEKKAKRGKRPVFGHPARAQFCRTYVGANSKLGLPSTGPRAVRPRCRPGSFSPAASSPDMARLSGLQPHKRSGALYYKV